MRAFLTAWLPALFPFVPNCWYDGARVEFTDHDHAGGTVEIHRKDGSVDAMQHATRIFPGDTVRVGDESQVTLRGGCFQILLARSTVVHMSYDPGFLDLEAGSIAVKTKCWLEGKYGSTLFAVRGTEFAVTAPPDGSRDETVRVAVEKGEVRVTPDGASPTAAESLMRGQFVHVREGQVESRGTLGDEALAEIGRAPSLRGRNVPFATPKLVGMPWRSALAIADLLGLDASSGDGPSVQLPADAKITRQRPTAGQDILRGDTVLFWVDPTSAGGGAPPRETPASVVPTLLGMEAEQAFAILDARDLGHEVIGDLPTDAFPPGTVSRQQPEADRAVSTGQVVSLWFEPFSVVPQVEGQPLESASAQLHEAELRPVVRSREPSPDTDVVVVQGQEPASSSTVGPWTDVWLDLRVPGVEVPDVTGLTEPKARARLEASGMRIGNVVTMVDDGVPPESVVKTEPSAGAAFTRGSVVEVDLFLALPERDLVLPNVIGMPLDRARGLLQNVGIPVDVVAHRPDRLPADTVLEMRPRSGSAITADTRLEVVLSSGFPQVILPRVIGASWIDARNQLLEVGLFVEGYVDEEGRIVSPADRPRGAWTVVGVLRAGPDSAQPARDATLVPGDELPQQAGVFLVLERVRSSLAPLDP